MLFLMHFPWVVNGTPFGFTPLHAAVLGAVQGLTEFLPISSSAHLFIVPHLLGWHYEGVAFDVALHGGTLVALLLAFWRDWWNLARDAFAPDSAIRTEARHLWVWLIVASIPAAIVGVLLERAAENQLRSMELQATMLLVFGFILWMVDRLSGPGREVRRPGWAMALGIGLAQVLALIPGVSRSGVTITAGRFARLTRVSAARLSFLLATPITLGAVLLKAKDLPADVPMGTLAVGVLTSAVVGLLAIRGFLKWLGRAGFGLFFAYRAVLALLIFLLVRVQT